MAKYKDVMIGSGVRLLGKDGLPDYVVYLTSVYAEIMIAYYWAEISGVQNCISKHIYGIKG